MTPGMPAPRALALASVLAAVAAPAPAQPARISNATLRRVSMDGGLAPTLDGLVRGATGPAWVGWSVPASTDRDVCCYRGTGGPGGCRLEDGEGALAAEVPAAPGVSLDEAPVLVVLLRIESGAVRRVRPVSEGCPVDGGGTTLHWLADVRPSESVAVLAGLVPDGEAGKAEHAVAEGAMAAIAHHADPAADRALERLVAPGRPRPVREQAAFWLGNARPGALPRLLRLARSDADERFREHLAFVLTQVGDERATDGLIGMAKSDESPRVRGQALFWLGQKAGRRAVGAIEEVLDSDPDAEIRKSAVFALSQLPRDEGVPLLIRTARTHSRRAVREQAFFWLGQSEDPRALAFFEEVLTR